MKYIVRYKYSIYNMSSTFSPTPIRVFAVGKQVISLHAEKYNT